MIKQLEFMEVLATVQIEYADFSYEADADDQEEEKVYLSAVSTAVCKVGKWCLQLYFNEDKLLPDQPELQQYYTNVQDFLVSKGIELLNTDKLEICWPMIDFLTPWI